MRRQVSGASLPACLPACRCSLAKLSEPIPTSPGVPAVHAAWRVCLKTLVKRKTDIYAAAGTRVTVYVRVSGGREGEGRRAVAGTR